MDEHDLAVAIRDAAKATGKTVATHDALVRMIRTWYAGAHKPSKRYQLLILRVLPAWKPAAGTAAPNPGPAAVLDRARRAPGPAEIDALEARAVRDEKSAALFAQIRDMERQIAALREVAEELFGGGEGGDV